MRCGQRLANTRIPDRRRVTRYLRRWSLNTPSPRRDTYGDSSRVGHGCVVEREAWARTHLTWGVRERERQPPPWDLGMWYVRVRVCGWDYSYEVGR